MKERTSTTHSTSGIPLHLHVWEPDNEPTAALVISHGLGEHCGRYAHVAEHFAARGFIVYGQDHCGFGNSGGRKGDVPSLEVVVSDLLALNRLIDSDVGDGARRVLLGHSMGGLIGLKLLQDHPQAFTEAIITGPSLNVTRGVNAVLLGLSKVLKVMLPMITLGNGLKPEDICSDPSVVTAYINDPLVHDRISPRLFNGLIAACRQLAAMPTAFGSDLSLLLMHGGADPICFADDSERFFERLSLEKKQLKIWPGMLHEILNEKDKALVLAEIDRFLGIG